MSTDDLMSKALAALGEVDGPMSVEVIHRLADTSDVDEPMCIADVAELLDVSAHTLRYYERAGLVTVDRVTSGHRTYSPEAVRRLVFLTRMRLSGMAIRDLQHYMWPLPVAVDLRFVQLAAVIGPQADPPHVSDVGGAELVPVFEESTPAHLGDVIARVDVAGVVRRHRRIDLKDAVLIDG